MNGWFIVRPRGDSEQHWTCAPWNGGLGGTYRLLSELTESQERAAEVLTDGLLTDPGGHYLCDVETDVDLCTVSVIALLSPIPVRPNRPAAVDQLDSGAGHTIPLPMTMRDQRDDAARRSWLQSLETGRGQSSWVASGQDARGDVYTGWIAEGGADAWVAERRAKEAARARARLKPIHDAGDSFINPYTFVPLPRGVDRSRPRGHATMGPDGLSGWFDWTLDFVTPLALPPDLRHTEGTALRYPGSSLRGALRNLHETLAHGCLREIDLDYTPVHREPMNVYRPADFRLGVVTKLDKAGNVLEVELTEQPIWVLSSVVHTAIPAGQLHSGSRVTVDPAGKRTRQGRLELVVPKAVTTGTDWVVHVTDAKPRNSHPDYYLAVGKLSGQRLRLDPEQWKAFQAEARGSQDLIGVEGTPAKTHDSGPGQPGWPRALVQHRGTDIGYRRKVDSWLGEGDTVWLTQGTDRGRLKMAVIWRRHGEVAVTQRLPEPAPGRGTNAPCNDPNHLCPTCAIFGAVDTEQGRDRQSGYASHVRVGTGVSAESVTRHDVDVPPLRSPKPSSGGFYLLHARADRALFGPSKDDDHVVRAHWGSKLDPPKAPRPIRGRKFYWHGQTPDGQPGRHEVRAQDADQVGTKAVARPPLRLTARVYFDNLDADQLAGLLAAADPVRAFGGEAGELATHVGGGKPLGFGTAKPSLSGVVVQSAASRYAGAKAPDLDLTASTRRFVAASTDTADRKAVWDSLRRVLTVDAVPADRIWYPTTGNFHVLAAAYPFDTPSRRSTVQDFDKTFNWFKDNSGGRPPRQVVRQGTREATRSELLPGALRLLPDATDLNQYLPTTHEADQ